MMVSNQTCAYYGTSIRVAVEKDLALGEEKEVFMMKLDIESAYRVVPVHPEDHQLLGMKWREGLYCQNFQCSGKCPPVDNRLDQEALRS